MWVPTALAQLNINEKNSNPYFCGVLWGSNTFKCAESCLANIKKRHHDFIRHCEVLDVVTVLIPESWGLHLEVQQIKASIIYLVRLPQKS